MQRLRSLILCLGILAAALPGCGILEPDSTRRLTLYVGPQTVDCVGVEPQQCLLVKESPGAQWSAFYTPIEGFTFEPGYTYTLRVLRSEVSDPPADSSSYRYVLLQILAKVPAPQA